MDGKGLAILVLLFLIALMVFYPQKRSDYTPSGDDPVGATPTDNKSAGDAKIMQGGGHISAPGGTFTSVDEPAPFDMGGSGVRTVDMPVYDNTNVGLIPKEVVTTEDFGQFSPDAILSGQNFLDPRAQIGFPETIGGNLRNANRDFRSEPPNPRDPVSIFNLSTIPPDTMRPKFEIENSYEK
ncbi:hypothetical protein EBT25_03980 [bacterium]|nr:hypothetical protein [bacterium]